MFDKFYLEKNKAILNLIENFGSITNRVGTPETLYANRHFSYEPENETKRYA
jgi:hypothetical protein